MHRLQNVWTRTTTVRDYVSSMCMEMFMRQLQVESAMTIMYKMAGGAKITVFSHVRNEVTLYSPGYLKLKRTKIYSLTSMYIYDLTDDGDQLLITMLHEASLEITRTDRDVLKLRISKLHLALMNISAAKLRRNAQILKECEHVKTVSEKSYCILTHT